MAGKTLTTGFTSLFLKRHKKLVKKSSKMVDAPCKSCDVDEVSTFFDNLIGLMSQHQYKEELVFNYDETMIEYLKKKVRLVMSIVVMTVANAHIKQR